MYNLASRPSVHVAGCHLLYTNAHTGDTVDVLCTIHGMRVWCQGYLDRRGPDVYEWFVDFYDSQYQYEETIVVSLASEQVRVLDHGSIDMREFIFLTVEEIVLHHEVRYSGDTDDGSITHLILTMILRTVVEEIIDAESPDFVSMFVAIMQVHLLEMIDNGRLVRTHEDDVDLAGETCVRLPPDAESDVKTEDIQLDE